MKYKYKLKEQEETSGEETPVGGGGSQEKIVYDLVLSPLSGTIGDVIAALENINNYGSYVSNIRNTKADVERAVEDYFGPNQRFAKAKLEKERGKPFPVKTKKAIDDFIKTLSAKPKLLRYEVVDDTLVFPAKFNPTKKVTEKIIATVMGNAGIKYNLDNKETLSELKKLVKEEILKFYKK